MILTAYTDVLSIEWRKDVGVYHGIGMGLGALVFFFTCNIAQPAQIFAVVLLPAFALIVLGYLSSHIVDTSREQSTGSADQVVMYPITGLTIGIYGILYGIVLYTVLQQVKGLDIVSLSATAIAIGAGLHIANSLMRRRYLPFGTVEKIMLLVLTVIFLAALAVPHEWHAGVFLLLLALFAYFDIADLSALTALSSTDRPRTIKYIGRGRMNIFIGMTVGIAGCIAIGQLTDTPFETMPAIHALASLGILLLLAIFTVFMPVQDNVVSDKAGFGHRSESILEAKCAEVSMAYALSKRESEVLVYLARGRNAEYIGTQLCISMYTAKAHIYHIYRKMGINAQAELMDIVEQTEVPL